MSVNLANILTFSRLFLTPVFVYLYIAEAWMWAFIVFCFAAFTDLIDGTVARMYGQQSKLGGLIDPLADKLLMQSCFVLLLIGGFIPPWFFAIALMRDLMIVSGIFYLENKRVELPYRAIWPSKLATLMQMMTASLGLLRVWLHAGQALYSPLETAQYLFMGLAALFIVVSGYQYVRMGLELLRQGVVRRA